MSRMNSRVAAPRLGVDVEAVRHIHAVDAQNRAQNIFQLGLLRQGAGGLDRGFAAR
jgi:hypothetical protein